MTKWYFTPNMGSYGAAVEIDADGNCCRIAMAAIAPDGQLAFLKWAPPISGLCKAKSSQVAPMTLYEVTEEHLHRIEGLFSSIIPVNGKPRLIP